MKNIVIILSIVIVMCCAMHIAEAMWSNVPLDKLIAQNPVVVVGKIEDIHIAEDPENKFDIAYIKVTEILKNSLADYTIQTGDRIPLSMPSANGMAASTDIRYRKGKEGVWILEYKDKIFLATYPKDYQPIKQKEKIARIISEQGKQQEKQNQTDAHVDVNQTKLIKVISTKPEQAKSPQSSDASNSN